VTKLSNRIRLLAAAGTCAAAILFGAEGFPRMTIIRPASAQTPQSHPYVGMWVTEDGHVRHNLLPNGRYDEARGSRESAYQGRYRVTGDHIDYWDDTGFTADGTFIDGVLHHGGMVLYRRE
jgi:hypothetical protein